MALVRWGRFAAAGAALVVAVAGAGAVVAQQRAALRASSVERMATLRREHAALRERLAAAVSKDGLAKRVATQNADVALAVRPGFVTDLAEETAHLYLSNVEMDLGTLRADTEGKQRARTPLGQLTLGEWTLDVSVERLRGRLQAGHPRLRFAEDRIEIELPVTVKPAPGTVGLAFAWNSAGVTNVVCRDFELRRELDGRVLAQEHVLTGAIHFAEQEHGLSAIPVFEERVIPLRLDLTPESWGVVEAALRSQDSLGRCGLLLKPEKVLAELRALASRGINVKLPDIPFQTARLPAQLQRQVTIGSRTVALSLSGEELRIAPDLLWSAASVVVTQAGSP